jgi:hypothetical protein
MDLVARIQEDAPVAESIVEFEGEAEPTLLHESEELEIEEERASPISR